MCSCPIFDRIKLGKNAEKYVLTVLHSICFNLYLLIFHFMNSTWQNYMEFSNLLPEKEII